MRYSLVRLACVVLLAVMVCALGPAALPPALPPPADHGISFAKEIKPLFEASCIQCHAKGKDKGGFSLETREGFFKGGDTGPAAVPGKSGESYVVKLVAGVDPDEQMPKKGKKWTAQQVGLLRAWIDQGAPWDAGITFARPQPANLKPRQVDVPSGNEQNPIDRILASYFGSRGIQPPRIVEDNVFARRAYLDVVGLLPMAKQLEEFVSDNDPAKRTKLVRQLLADRRGYADHWMTFWNDLLRNDYRGTGFIDGGRRQISGWLYAALINDEPYDQFVSDLVSPGKATEPFSRGIIWRGTVNASQLPPMQAAQNVSQVFMGVNLKCASCHDSFVNDWTLADAYGMAAVFSDGPLELVHCDKPTGKTSTVKFLYQQIGQIDPKADKPKRMKRLAELMTCPDDGRLSRTIVNRLWAKLLGRGLVEPVDDMDKPAWDPDLLDWLADDLVAHHYDLKRTIEVICTSDAYQLPSIDVPVAEKDYVFRGPGVRRMTAEQFCDAVSSLSDDWAREPATLDIDFTTGDLIGPIRMPTWIWTDKSVEDGQFRADLQQRATYEDDDDEGANKAKKNDKPADAKSGSSAKGQAAAKADSGTKLGSAPGADEPKPPPRHRVVFRKTVVLDDAPHEAFATLAASQSFALAVNGKLVRPILSDGQRAGRVALYNLKSNLVAGRNTIMLEVSSHTQKELNDVEEKQFPASRNHLNKVSGVAFYLRADREDGKFSEITTDESWHVLRAPPGRYRDEQAFDDEWPLAVALPEGVAPVDEGRALPPITRKDYANEPIELGDVLRPAVSTAAQPGHIRASLLASDALMTALDRPNREQVITFRSTAPSTLQALELTHGNSLDQRLKRAAHKLLPAAKDDPSQWVTEIYRHALGRVPTEDELTISIEMLGDPVKEQGVADFLWTVTALPEFQFIQ